MKQRHQPHIHINTTPSQHPQPCPGPGAHPEREWDQPGHCSFLPLPAKLREWAREMTWHVSRWQRQV